LLFGAGVAGGAVGSAGGITSLLTYPALLAVGIRPLPANVTNSIALIASWPGSALGSRPELRGQGARLRPLLLFTAVGGVVGAILLLVTPAGAFVRLVPFLLVLASALLLAQPRISTWRETRTGERMHYLLPIGLFVVAVYDGYFGAGAGVMTLALMLVLEEQHVARANAFKNMVIGAADVCAGVGFAIFGPVHWWAALYLALGALLGSSLGPSVTRRVPGNVLRVVVALAGIGLAIHLWVSPS
jgi:hypothetical protein